MNPEDIINYWIPNDKYQSFWFDKTPDEYIKTNYLALLNNLEGEGELYNTFNETMNGKLALIICFDQFTRNIYRDNDDKYKNDKRALKIALEIYNENADCNFNLPGKLFCLMPFRHSRKKVFLNYVVEKIKEYKEIYKNNSLLNKFEFATYQSLGDLEENMVLIDSTKKINYILLSEYNVLDDVCSNYDNLLFYDFQNINKKIINNKLYTIILKYFENKFPIFEDRNIGVSLSGGVDSMVILFILFFMKYNKQINSVYALHIEYINRNESNDETKFLIEYCNLLNIELYIRKIDYMSRDSVDRNFYESETKRVRFNSYKYLVKNHNVKGFCMGHHFGDLGENVLMNIFNGRDILDLFVMEDDSVIDEVRLFRPLLNNPKSDIYSLAHIFQIPYFKDSTPDWSCRGVLRRKIMPVLIDQWGSGIYNNLADIGMKSQELNKVVNKFIINDFLENIEFKKNGCKITLYDKYLDLPQVIWSNIFLQLFHKLGKHMISKKNLTSFLDCIKDRITKSSQYNFSNDTFTIIDYNTIYIFCNNFNNISDKKIVLNNNYEDTNIKITVIPYDKNKEVRNPITYDNILDGYYHYTEQINDDRNIYITNNFDDKDTTRKLFTKIPLIKKYITKITSAKVINKNLLANIELYF